MEIEKLYDLTGIPARTRMDAETILFSLELKPNGYATTTAIQMERHFGASRLENATYMRDLDLAIRFLAETHGLVLQDWSIGGTPEALKFGQKFVVMHTVHSVKDVLMSCDPHDETAKLAAKYVNDVLGKSLPTEMIPEKPRFAYRHLPVCDVAILDVFCGFTYKLLKFELKFELNTDRGYPSRAGDPKPHIQKLSFTCDRDEGDEKDFMTTWDLVTGEWTRPWLIEDSISLRPRGKLSGLLFRKSKDSPVDTLEAEYPFLPWKREQ
jgi:hypothetical protein